MNKIWLISIGVIVIIGLIALAFLLAGSGGKTPSNSQTGQNVGLPVANPVGNSSTVTEASSTFPTGTTLSVGAVGGGSVQTNNFIADPTTTKDPINPGYYYLGYHVYEGVPDPTATNNPPYIITYISTTQYFNIALLQEPVGSTREEMEQYLMARLSISQTQMCQLNYMVSVPDHVNSFYSGQNLGFSFCPGATALLK